MTTRVVLLAIVTSITLIAICGLLFGCADVKVMSLADAKAKAGNGAIEGVRFYKPHPYLLVVPSISANTNQDLTSLSYEVTVVYLPEMTDESTFVADIKPGWGSVDAKLKLQDGWQLTEFGEVVDSKGPETISSIAELVKAMPAGVLTAQDAGNAVPVLYRIEFAAGGVSLKKVAFN